MRCYRFLVILIIFKFKGYFFLLLQFEKCINFLNFKNVQDKYLQLKRSIQVFADEPDSSLAKCSEKVCNFNHKHVIRFLSTCCGILPDYAFVG